MKRAKILKEWFDGKKTYFVVAAMVLLGVLQGFEIYEISTAGWVVLGAFGLGFLRSGVNKISKTIKENRK